MNLKFWQRDPKPTPRSIPIPPEHRRRIMELVRDYERAPFGSRSWEHYLMWEAVAELIPEVADGNWQMGIGNPLHLCVINKPKG